MLPDNDYYEIDKKTGCWNFLGSKSNKGYGQKWNGKRGMRAHNYYYEKMVGKIPEGMILDHLCKNKICVNPAHLEPVTNAENVRRGDKAKLNHKQISEIKNLYFKDKFKQTLIALKFNVNQSEISRILNNKRWAYTV